MRSLSIEHIRHPHTAENIGDNISFLDELELRDKIFTYQLLPEEINVESIEDVFTELEICDDSDMYKKIDLDKPMQISRVLERLKKLCIVPCVFTEKKIISNPICLPRIKKFDFAPDKIKQI
ncbi:3614_t:CDS:2 [Racocetra fulgida]|uniref:3614_t:CDS:1 n=1 Tax=Racocetra fulgida TaxID=60492 RepID=A0A9N9AWU1_9GLOM|nr:3614_t:CDS:2 [Racocetra fulgida]